MKYRKPKYSSIPRARKTKKKSTLNNLPIFKINILVCILAFTFIVGNIVMLNSVTSKGYEIKKVESELQELKAENQNLSLNLSNGSSMDELLSRANELGMVEADSISYITMPSSAVARK